MIRRTSGQVIFLKKSRIVTLLLCTLVFVIVLSCYGNLQSYDENQPNQGLFNVLKSSQDLSVDIAAPSGGNRSNLAKYIHLDLKGAPPKVDKFYEQFFNFLQGLQMGVKGVLIEYEDTLPLEGDLFNVSTNVVYTKEEILLIQDAAKRHQLEVIPLIQTFGHLEWILKLERFRSYRDYFNSSKVIAPCLNATYSLLEDLLQQTLDMHPASNIIHIGCDEVILNNSNPACAATQLDNSAIYINHVRRIVSIVQKIRPGIRILIWDDILRGDDLVHNNALFDELKYIVEPVSWKYYAKFDKAFKTSPAWSTYPQYFTTQWAASAFKGGLNSLSISTDTAHHVFNNREWLHFMESPVFTNGSFSGIILTGWSRFDHFLPLCDILPTAYASLVYSLYVLYTDIYQVDESIDNCQDLLQSINKDVQLCDSLPGHAIWPSIASLSTLLFNIQTRLKVLNTMLPKPGRKNRLLHHNGVRKQLSELRLLQNEFLSAAQNIRADLAELYCESVINEWITLYITPTANELAATFDDISAISDVPSRN